MAPDKVGKNLAANRNDIIFTSLSILLVRSSDGFVVVHVLA
jgi:hypothetical protein